MTEPREPETPQTEGAQSAPEPITGDAAQIDAGLVAPAMPQIPTMPVPPEPASDGVSESLPTVTVPLVVPVIPVLAAPGDEPDAVAEEIPADPEASELAAAAEDFESEGGSAPTVEVSEPVGPPVPVGAAEVPVAEVPVSLPGVPVVEVVEPEGLAEPTEVVPVSLPGVPGVPVVEVVEPEGLAEPTEVVPASLPAEVSEVPAVEAPVVSLPGAPVMPVAPAVPVTPLPVAPEAPLAAAVVEPTVEPLSGTVVEPADLVEPAALVEPGPEGAYLGEPIIPGGAYADLLASEEQAVTEEERKLAVERAARRDARTAAFTSEPQFESAGPISSVPVAAAVATPKKATDGFWASLGLFLVRLVLAAIFGVRGVQMLLEPQKTQQMLTNTVVPVSVVPIVATVAAVGCLLVALAMLLGLATRAAGLGAALVTGGALALVYWGASFSIFRKFEPGTLEFGFWGEEQLLITVIGLLILFIGAGGWSVDRSLRASRQRDKAARAAD